MKRVLSLALALCMLCASGLCESLPQATPFNGLIDFDAVLPENAAATPVAADPIDKPTPTPAPTPNYVYDTYVSEDMGISFSIPYTWIVNPNTDPSQVLQFVEPQSEMQELNGYQTRLTIEKITTGSVQSAANARLKLEEVIDELRGSFTSFTPGDIASATFGDASGYYCYYKCEYTDEAGKNYSMNGRVMVFAKDRALFQVRLTAPRSCYTYYQYVYRKVRSTIKFL